MELRRNPYRVNFKRVEQIVEQELPLRLLSLSKYEVVLEQRQHNAALVTSLHA